MNPNVLVGIHIRRVGWPFHNFIACCFEPLVSMGGGIVLHGYAIVLTPVGNLRDSGSPNISTIGPFSPPAKQAHTICLGLIHSLYHISVGVWKTHTGFALEDFPFEHSSLQLAFNHCSSVQFLGASAHASLFAIFLILASPGRRCTVLRETLILSTSTPNVCCLTPNTSGLTL